MCSISLLRGAELFNMALIIYKNDCLWYKKGHLKFCSFLVNLTNSSRALLHCVSHTTFHGGNNVHFANNLLNERTQEINIKFNVYSPSLNLFCLAELTVEILATNGIKTRANFVVTKLFAVGGILDTFSVVSHVFVFVFFLVFTYREVKHVYQWRRKYFKNTWNVLQGILILVILSCVVVFFLRLALVEGLLTRLEENNQHFINFDTVVFMDDILGILIAFVVFLSWFCFIKFLQFNRRLSFLQDTLGNIAQPLATYSIVFLTVFAAYVHSGYLLFSRDLETFNDLRSSFTSLCSVFMGDFDFSSLQNSNRIFGPLFIFSALFFGGFIIINLLIALILESFLAVKMKNKANQYDLLEYVKKHLRYWFGPTGQNTPRSADLRNLNPGKNTLRDSTPGKNILRDSTPEKNILRDSTPGKFILRNSTLRDVTVRDKSFCTAERVPLGQNPDMKISTSKQETGLAGIATSVSDLMTSLESVCAEDWNEEVMFHRLVLKGLKLACYDCLDYVNDIDRVNLEDLGISLLRNELYDAVEKYSQEFTDRVELSGSLVSSDEELAFSTFDLNFEVCFQNIFQIFGTLPSWRSARSKNVLALDLSRRSVLS
jgi:hypothetical protein